MKYIANIVTPRSVSIVFDDGKRDKLLTVNHTDIDRFEAAKAAIAAKKFEDLEAIMCPEEAMMASGAQD